MKIKITHSLKDKNLLAGKVYEVDQKLAKKLIAAEMAVEIKKQVKDGNG